MTQQKKEIDADSLVEAAFELVGMFATFIFRARRTDFVQL